MKSMMLGICRKNAISLPQCHFGISILNKGKKLVRENSNLTELITLPANTIKISRVLQMNKEKEQINKEVRSWKC